MRLIPSRRWATWKLISRPTPTPLSRMYESNWGLVNRVDSLDTLHLDDDKVLDQEVNAISKLNPFAFVNDGQSDLAGNIYALLPKLMEQASLISAFEQARAQDGMNFHGGRHNLASDVVNARRDRLRESSHESPIPQLRSVPL